MAFCWRWLGTTSLLVSTTSTPSLYNTPLTSYVVAFLCLGNNLICQKVIYGCSPDLFHWSKYKSVKVVLNFPPGKTHQPFAAVHVSHLTHAWWTAAHHICIHTRSHVYKGSSLQSITFYTVSDAYKRALLVLSIIVWYRPLFGLSRSSRCMTNTPTDYRGYITEPFLFFNNFLT